MSLQRTYYPARQCSGGSTPGAKALMSWFLGAYSDRGAVNLGIYNCRYIDGSTVLSLHAEGRACDLGCPVGNTWMTAVTEAMRLNSAELGIQSIIYNRRVWSARQPDAGWRRYTGTNAHTNHAHVELTPDAAKSLTVSRINGYLGGTFTWMERIMNALPELAEGAEGVMVMRLQALLNILTSSWTPPIQLAEDGVFGRKTDAVLRAAQVMLNIPKSVKDGQGDGKCGPNTWAVLLGVD